VGAGRTREPGLSFALRRHSVSDVLALRSASIHPWCDRKHTATNRRRVHQGMTDFTAVDLPSDPTYYLCGPLPFM
jgi:nitric oxide dioxygenase